MDVQLVPSMGEASAGIFLAASDGRWVDGVAHPPNRPLAPATPRWPLERGQKDEEPRWANPILAINSEARGSCRRRGKPQSGFPTPLGRRLTSPTTGSTGPAAGIS